MKECMFGWEDSKVRQIDGRRFATVYDIGKFPLAYEVKLDRYGRDVWYRCEWVTIESAIAVEQHKMMAELDDQREDERPTLWY